jgi:hypothetical protein
VCWLLAGFAACQAVLAAAVDGWLTDVRDPEFAGKLACLRACRAEAPGQPLVVALGSSRTAFGLVARMLSADPGTGGLVFNFGLMGGGPVLELVTLRRLLNAGVRPDLLYVELMPTMMADVDGHRQEERLLDGARLQAGEVWRLRGHYHEPARLFGSWALGRLLPCYRHQAELRGRLPLDGAPVAVGLDGSSYDSHGWCGRMEPRSPEDNRLGWAITLKQYGILCAAPDFAPEPVAALEALLGLCRREGIPVTLVLMPEGAPFRALYTPAAREALTGLLSRLRRNWSVPVVDARLWVEDAGFWDNHHMVWTGAVRFTERLGREAVRPALASLPRGIHCAAR